MEGLWNCAIKVIECLELSGVFCGSLEGKSDEYSAESGSLPALRSFPGMFKEGIRAICCFELRFCRSGQLGPKSQL